MMMMMMIHQAEPVVIDDCGTCKYADLGPEDEYEHPGMSIEIDHF